MTINFFRNIINHPKDEDKKRLRVANPKFHEKVWRHASAQNFFQSSGDYRYNLRL